MRDFFRHLEETCPTPGPTLVSMWIVNHWIVNQTTTVSVLLSITNLKSNRIGYMIILLIAVSCMCNSHFEQFPQFSCHKMNLVVNFSNCSVYSAHSPKITVLFFYNLIYNCSQGLLVLLLWLISSRIRPHMSSYPYRGPICDSDFVTSSIHMSSYP